MMIASTFEPDGSDRKARRIWIFNHYAGLPEHVPAMRPYELTRRLVTLGWDVTVIASAFSHYTRTPDWSVPEGEDWIEHTRDGVKWVFLKTPGYRGNGADRFRDMLAYSRLGKRWATTQRKPDVVVGTCVHPFAAGAASRIARSAGVPFVYEVTDLWPASLVDLGRLRRMSPLYWLLFHMERRAFRDSALVAGVLPGIAAYANDAHKVVVPSFVYVPNGFADESVPLTVPLDGDRGNVVYVGGFSHSHDLKTLVAAAAILAERRPGRFQFQLYGDGPAREEVESQIADLRLTNVHLHGFVAKKDVPRVLSSARLCLVTGLRMPIHRYGVSTTKMFDYFAAAKPIAFAVDSSNNPVQEADAGLSVPAGNPAALANAIEEIDGWSASQRIEAGLRGRAYLLANHGYARTSERFHVALLELLNRSADKI